MISERLLAELEDSRASHRVLFLYLDIELRDGFRCSRKGDFPGGRGELPSPLKDGTNSVRVVVDEAGAVVATHDYDAFGNILAESVPTGAGGQPWPFEHRAFGELYDRDLGMTFHRARWMDASDGRFVSRDRFGGVGAQPASLHRYSYAASDPLNKTDPSGHLIPQLVAIGVLGSLFIPASTAVAADLENPLADAGCNRTPGNMVLNPEWKDFEPILSHWPVGCRRDGDWDDEIEDDCGGKLHVDCRTIGEFGYYLNTFTRAGGLDEVELGYCPFFRAQNRWQYRKNQTGTMFLEAGHWVIDKDSGKWQSIHVDANGKITQKCGEADPKKNYEPDSGFQPDYLNDGTDCSPDTRPNGGIWGSILDFFGF